MSTDVNLAELLALRFSLAESNVEVLTQKLICVKCNTDFIIAVGYLQNPWAASYQFTLHPESNSIVNIDYSWTCQCPNCNAYIRIPYLN